MESTRHKALKALLSDFFLAAGWTAVQEAIQPDHPLRPDVFVADDNGRQAAFEVELSKTGAQALRRRQEKYRQAQIRVIWLLARQPRGISSSAELPFFVLGPEPEKDTLQRQLIQVDERWRPINEFLDALLNEQLAWRAGQPEYQRSGYLITFPGCCWVCQQQFTAIRGLQAPTCRCGKYLDYPEDLNQAVFQAVIDHSPVFERLEPRFGPLARIQRRRTKLAPEPYLANHCPHCRKLQGDFFLHSEAAAVLYRQPSRESRPEWPEEADSMPTTLGQMQSLAVPRDVFRRRGPQDGAGHWCLDDQHQQ